MSHYVRKTRTYWFVQQYTGKQYGWEDVSGSFDRKEAQSDRKAYRENQPEYPVRILPKRVRLDAIDPLKSHGKE